MDSLRYWVEEMHVDGFRFDLASALAREDGKVEDLGGFFDAIRQDPTLNQVKLIAEPWDLGHGGYQVGNFPLGWAEWNDRYRDGMRALLEGRRRADRRGRAAPHRLAGSLRLVGQAPAREHQLRHRARRLHPARPGLLQREAQRGQRRGQPRRQQPQPVVELRRRGADRRPGDRRPARAPEAQLARHAAAVAGRADAARRRRARPHPAGQQQRLLPGQRDSAGSTGRPRPSARRWPASCAALIALRRAHPSFRRRSFFVGRPIDGDARQGRPWLKPDGAEMQRRGLERRARALPGDADRRGTASPTAAGAASASSTTTSCSSSTRPTSRSRSRCPAATSGAGACCSTAPTTASAPARSLTVPRPRRGPGSRRSTRSMVARWRC